jgi:hypothetical protein
MLRCSRLVHLPFVPSGIVYGNSWKLRKVSRDNDSLDPSHDQPPSHRLHKTFFDCPLLVEQVQCQEIYQKMREKHSHYLQEWESENGQAFKLAKRKKTEMSTSTL